MFEKTALAHHDIRRLSCIVQNPVRHRWIRIDLNLIPTFLRRVYRNQLRGALVYVELSFHPLLLDSRRESLCIRAYVVISSLPVSWIETYYS